MLGEVINQLNNATGDTPTSIGEIYAWNQMSGQKASSSETIYGIYDLSGGAWERTAAYTANNDGSLTAYGKSLLYNGSPTNETSTKYTTVYAHNTNGGTAINTASQKNYDMAANKRRFGNAMAETSTDGIGSKSWYGDYSYFVGLAEPFSLRGGSWSDSTHTGLFSFHRTDGNSGCNSGFRAVLVAFQHFEM